MKKINIQNLIIKIIAKFEDETIKYAILRNYEKSFVDLAKDLDLLIDHHQEKKIISIIKYVCKDFTDIIYVKQDHKRTTISILLKKEFSNKENNEIFTFDLNKYINLKKNYNLSKRKGLGSKIRIKDVKVIKYFSKQIEQSFSILDRDTEIIFLINHLLNKKKQNYLDIINLHLNKKGLDSVKSLNDNLNISLKLNELIVNSKFKIPKKQFILHIQFFLIFLKNKCISYKFSKVIYYSGPDGAGKSTSYLSTMEVFDKLKIKYYPLRGMQIGMQYYLYFRKYLRGENTKVKALNQVGKLGFSDIKRDRDTGKFNWKIRRFIGLFIGLLDICFIGRFFVFLKKMTGSIIIIEESPMDIFVKRHRPRNQFLEFVFIPFIPSPTRSILCVADENVIFKRKPELDKNEIINYYIIIKDLYNSNLKFKKNELYTDIPIEKTELDLKNILDNTL